MLAKGSLISGVVICVLGLAGCGNSILPQRGDAGIGAQGDGGDDTCVQTVLCVQGKHWSGAACACVPDAPADSGAKTCVDNVLCIRGSHWSSSDCQCVSDGDGGSADADAGATPGDAAATDSGPTVCVEHVLCIVGKHWSSADCKCVPDNLPGDAGTADSSAACVSQQGGPCGGFVVNPCTCAAGLTCVSSGIPDVGGTCQAQTKPTDCCPTTWNMYTCKQADGSEGYACHNPAMGCASSETCGAGCDKEVTGACPVCDPLPCPSGKHWDSTQCACVEGCESASDCSGILPHSCLVCAGGTTGCAHWACTNHKCQVAYCE